jgi:hypothetical protein
MTYWHMLCLYEYSLAWQLRHYHRPAQAQVPRLCVQVRRTAVQYDVDSDQGSLDASRSASLFSLLCTSIRRSSNFCFHAGTIR